MPEAIAVFGGSFDPPHLAHQMICMVVLETEAVDRVLMIPAVSHAFGKELAPYDDRLEMCRRAAGLFGGMVEVSTMESELAEAERGRTYHLLHALRAAYPEAAFRLVVGADILAEKDAWYRWDDVVAMAPLIVVGRAGSSTSTSTLELPDVSSTEVRARIARGESALPLVSRSVMDYIAERGLYR